MIIQCKNILMISWHIEPAHNNGIKGDGKKTAAPYAGRYAL